MSDDDSGHASKQRPKIGRAAIVVACGILVVATVWIITSRRGDVDSNDPEKDTTAEQSGGIDEETENAPGESATLDSDESKEREYSYPTFVSRYEIATQSDMKYAFLLKPLVGTDDDMSTWKLLSEARKHLGNAVGNLLDAESIANTITTSMPVGGNKPLKPIDDLVADCAKVLDIPKPEVFIRNDPVAQAYVTGVKAPHILVITSGLLDLYDGKPDELRFVIGHELGHIKCDHIRMKAVGVALLMALSKINEKAIGDSSILPTLGLGRFLSWSREAEISADRAGLLCCQDPQVAFNAMARLMHGLSSGSGWPDPNNPDFDAEQIVSNFEQWESRPFVEFLVHWLISS